MKRRTFLKQTGVLASSLSVFPSVLRAQFGSDVLTGIQLYSIRDEMKADPLGTLKQLSAMGYRHVEHANYVGRKFYGWTREEFKKILGDLGMTMPSGHTIFLTPAHWNASAKDFTDAWKHTVEDAAYMGQQFVISPAMTKPMYENYDNFMQTVELFNKCGELCRAMGMKFGYHNHDFEFTAKLNDQTMYDLLLRQTDPDLVMQQLDIGNMYNGNAKAIDWLTRYPGRFPSMHVKDEIRAEKQEGQHAYESTLLGKGIIGVKEMIDLGKSKGGTIHFIVEQEAYQGISPIECARRNLDAMKGWGYA